MNATKDSIDIMSIHDKSGYSPIHYASYKNMLKASAVIINFLLQEDYPTTPNKTGGFHRGVDKIYGRNLAERKSKLEAWINEASTGDDGFTALHFAAFHGNMQIVKLLIKYGADPHA